MLQAGTVVTLTVARQADFGHFLTNGEQDVLLHQYEQLDTPDIGTEMDVFLYRDKQQRLAATMHIPDIQIGKYGWADVTEVKSHLGVFLHIGIQKEVLLSKDELPKVTTSWPAKGDRLYVTLDTDNKGRLLAKLANGQAIKQISAIAPPGLYNQNISGRVYRTLRVGSYIISDVGFLGFIHQSERKEEPRLGEWVHGRVIEVKEDGSLNVSLLPRKQESLVDDAEIIYTYMEAHGGAMPYGDKSRAEDIKLDFNMSKSAFKRALGKLMKEKKVYQKDGWTYFVHRQS